MTNEFTTSDREALRRRLIEVEAQNEDKFLIPELRRAERAWEECRKLWGEDAFYTVDSRRALANTLFQLREFVAARDHQEAVLRAWTSQLGERHLSTIRAGFHLACTLGQLGLLQEAVDHQRRALRSFEELVRGKENTQEFLRFTMARGDYALLLYAVGDRDEAIALQRVVADTMRSWFGEEFCSAKWHAVLLKHMEASAPVHISPCPSDM